MKEEKLWEFIRGSLAKGQPLVLLVVVHNTSGSPGRQGFKMAVNSLGEMEGTIGGGIMEYKLLRVVKDMLTSKEKLPKLVRRAHNKNDPEDWSGMICAGTQKIVLCPCYPEMLELPDRKLFFQGSMSLTQDGLRFDDKKKSTQHRFFIEKSSSEWIYEENLEYKSRLYIAGGGHVGLALSKVMALLDFHVTVFDHRPEVKTILENSYAHEIVITDFDKIGTMVADGEDSYVAIVSTNFKTDEAALRALMTKDLRYLGIMGSTAKLRHLFGILRSEGHSDGVLKKIHAPIGVPIHSRTVEEIGVSIAAELVQAKNS